MDMLSTAYIHRETHAEERWLRPALPCSGAALILTNVG
jgi:hypothetical protein